MPFEQVIPAVFPAWEVDMGWPWTYYLNGAVGTAAGSVESRHRVNYPGNGNISPFFTNPTAAAHINPNYVMHKGLYAVTPQPQPTIRSSVLFFGDNVCLPGPFDNQGFTAGGEFMCNVPVVPYRRAFIDEFLIAFTNTAPNLSVDNMLCCFTPDSGAVTTSLFGNTGTHYGIRMAGLQTVEFYSVRASVLQESVTLTWPVSDWTQWVKIGVEHLMATPAGAAQVRFFLNDVPVITRSWGAGTTLPNLSAGSARHMRRYFGQSVAEPLDEINFSMFRVRAGRFTIDNTELL